MKKSKLNPGDRIGYSASFLKSICAGYETAQARGVYVGAYAAMPDKFGRVHWDDEAARIKARQGCFIEQDYCDEVKANGSLVALANIARFGSTSFND